MNYNPCEIGLKAKLEGKREVAGGRDGGVRSQKLLAEGWGGKEIFGSWSGNFFGGWVEKI